MEAAEGVVRRYVWGGGWRVLPRGKMGGAKVEVEPGGAEDFHGPKQTS